MRYQLTSAPRPYRGKTLDQSGQLVVRDRDENQLSDLADLWRRHDRSARQKGFSPRPGCV
jgi:hypothetical protein